MKRNKGLVCFPPIVHRRLLLVSTSSPSDRSYLGHHTSRQCGGLKTDRLPTAAIHNKKPPFKGIV